MKTRIVVVLVAMLAACGEERPQTELERIARSALSCPVGTVTWSIDEGAAGGSVTSAGVYTAPPCNAPYTDATYHVRATGCGNSVAIPVAVGDNVRAVEILCAAIAPATCCTPPPITMAPGGTAQWYAAVRYNCSGHVEYPLPPPAFCP